MGYRMRNVEMGESTLFSESPPSIRQVVTHSVSVTPLTNPADTHDRLIASILTHYRALTMLATIKAEGERNNANPESVAVSSISMKMEFDGLVSFFPSTCPSPSAPPHASGSPSTLLPVDSPSHHLPRLTRHRPADISQSMSPSHLPSSVLVH